MLTKVESYCKLSRLVQESSEYKYGGIAQLARARGSYPRCRWFKSSSRYFLLQFFVCNGRQTQTRKGYYVKMLRITALKLLDRNLSLI